MPTYQYQCENCKYRFECRQSFSAKPTAVCPVCHGVALRLFSPVPILFKGSGFYITDSRKEGESSFETKGLERKENEVDKGGKES